MKAKVTTKGVLIPKRMFKGVKEVEIKKEENAVVVIPIDEDDPIFQLGKNPVDCGVTDASEFFDKYLYNFSR
jgi:virulence-associated protein VagC